MALLVLRRSWPLRTPRAPRESAAGGGWRRGRTLDAAEAPNELSTESCGHRVRARRAAEDRDFFAVFGPPQCRLVVDIGEHGKCRSARSFVLERSQTCILDGFRGRKSQGLLYAHTERNSHPGMPIANRKCGAGKLRTPSTAHVWVGHGGNGLCNACEWWSMLTPAARRHLPAPYWCPRPAGDRRTYLTDLTSTWAFTRTKPKA